MPLEQVNIGTAENDPNADTLRAAFAKVNALVAATNQAQSDLGAMVTALEGKPGKRWDGFVEKLIWAVAAATVGFVLAQIGLGLFFRRDDYDEGKSDCMVEGRGGTRAENGCADRCQR